MLYFQVHSSFAWLERQTHAVSCLPVTCIPSTLHLISVLFMPNDLYLSVYHPYFLKTSFSPQCSSVLSEKQSEGFFTKFSVLCLQYFLQFSIEVLCLSYQMAVTRLWVIIGMHAFMLLSGLVSYGYRISVLSFLPA